MNTIILNILLNFLPEIKEYNLENILSVPPNPEMGDISIPCFPFASILKISPAQAASDFAKRFADNPDIQAKVIWPYLNLTFSDSFLWNEFLKSKVISEWEKKNQKVMVEFSSPNTNKPQHLWHVRTNLIWMALSSILKRDWYDVVRASLCNDRWIAICKSMLAYKYFWEGKTPEDVWMKWDHFVWDFYVRYGELAPLYWAERIEAETSEMLLKWEAWDQEVLKLWRMMNDWTLAWWEVTYKKMWCEFDFVYFESDTYQDWKDIVSEWLNKWVFGKKENGAIFADLSKYGLWEKILQRWDWTSIYITQDIGTTLRKFKEHSLDKSVWVVASEQDHHFKCLFAILDMLGYSEIAKNCFHLSYWYISLPTWRMKSREWTIVDADWLMEELEVISQEIMKEHDAGISQEELIIKTDIIAMAALKFFILQYGSSKDFVFDPKASISFEGKTGPYILYSYARIKSILRKAWINEISIGPEASLSELAPQEKLLVKDLLNYSEAIKTSSKEYEPSILVKYLYELAQDFNTFYHHLPIMTEENEKIKNSRLYLIIKVAEVLKDWLSLLGIKTLERM